MTRHPFRLGPMTGLSRGTCPRCGTAVVHATVGSRSTWWCPQEQV